MENIEEAEPAPTIRIDQAVELAHAPLERTILVLQRSAGNRAVGSLLRSRRRLARVPSLPGFSQNGDTCGAASLVTALFLWDIERGSADNRAVVHACDLALTDRDRAGVNAAAKTQVQTLRALAMTPAFKLGLTQYQQLSEAFAVLYNARAGMTSGQISNLAKGIGLRASGSGTGNTIHDILLTDEVKNLKPGEVGQLNWIIASTGGGHAMLLGRHEDGTWFFSDQGQSPPKQMQTGTHPDLVSAVDFYVRTGSWLYDGNKLDLQSMPPVTGFVPMGHIQSFLNRGPEMLITPGEKLAEIDAGWDTVGEVITAWDYHSRWDSLSDAKDAITKDPGHHGGVIVERPRGMFHIWKTNPIKDADNLKMTDIDKGDSANMALVAKISSFYSAWVVLSDPSGTKGTPFEVKP